MLVAFVAAGAVNAGIAAAAVGLGADPGVTVGLRPPLYLLFTLADLLGGAVGWVIVRRLAPDPAVVLRVLVPVIVGVLMVPDLLDGLTIGWGPLALALMHPVVGAVGVLAFRRFLPLPHREPEPDQDAASAA